MSKPYRLKDYVIGAVFFMFLAWWFINTGHDLDKQQRIRDHNTPTTIPFMDPRDGDQFP